MRPTDPSESPALLRWHYVVSKSSRWGLYVSKRQPVTKYTLLAHFFNFELFIFENEIKIGVCLLLSREGAPKKLKATTITKLKKLKIGFLTTLSSECIWQQFFSRICFEFLLPTKMPFSKRFFSHEFFEFLVPTKMPFLKRFYSHEFSNQNSNFSWGLNGGKYGSKN